MTVFPAGTADDVFPDTATTVVPYATGKLRESAVLTNDGRVLYVFREGSAIKQGYASSEGSFFTNGSVGSVTTILTGLGSHAGSVFRAANGNVYLAVSAAFTPDGSSFVRIYESPSNNGGDWVLRSTVHNFVTCGGYDFDTDNWAVGIPYTDAGGTWVLAGPLWYQGFFFCDWIASHSSVWRSTDHGLTWALVLRVPFAFVGGPYGYGHNRNLPLHNGTLWVSMDGQLDGIKNHTSANFGASWANVAGTGGAVNFCGSDGDYLYAMAPNGGTVYRSTDVAALGWTTFRTYALGNGSSNYASVFQRLGDSYFISCGGRMVDAGLDDGWVVGAVTLG